MTRKTKSMFFIFLALQSTLLLAYFILRHNARIFRSWQIGLLELEHSTLNETVHDFNGLTHTIDLIANDTAIVLKRRRKGQAWAITQKEEDKEKKKRVYKEFLRSNGTETTKGPSAVAQMTTQTNMGRIPALTATNQHWDHTGVEEFYGGAEGVAFPNVRKTASYDGHSPEPFQQIDDKPAWVYSAYYDHISAERGKPMVRVLALVRRELLQTVFCGLSSNGSNLEVTATVKQFPDSHGVSYPPSYVDCYLATPARPTHLSISFQAANTTSNRLQITYPGPRIRNFTVCYSILHSRYSWASQLIESIEMNRILGAEHFFIYNYSISPEVDQILRRYQEDGIVTVLPWSLPTEGSWYYAQTLALNDCFYRNRNVSRFVIVTDTDEFIIPRKQSSWMELIHHVSPKEYDVARFFHPSDPPTMEQTTTNCFVVMSSYFSMDSIPNWTSFPSEFQFSQEEKNNTVKYKILTLSQMWRAQNIYPHKVKSKYIARPELVYSAGIHFVHKLVSSGSCLNVDSNLTLVQHYRKTNMKSGIVMDTSILKFKSRLYPRIMEQFKLFPKIFT